MRRRDRSTLDRLFDGLDLESPVPDGVSARFRRILVDRGVDLDADELLDMTLRYDARDIVVMVGLRQRVTVPLWSFVDLRRRAVLDAIRRLDNQARDGNDRRTSFAAHAAWWRVRDAESFLDVVVDDDRHVVVLSDVGEQLVTLPRRRCVAPVFAPRRTAAQSARSSESSEPGGTRSLESASADTPPSARKNC